jgi:hypothetical protein
MIDFSSVSDGGEICILFDARSWIHKCTKKKNLILQEGPPLPQSHHMSLMDFAVLSRLWPKCNRHLRLGRP